jgi:hypothetical protein
MSHIIQDFGQWKKVNEDDLPGRERERGGSNNKVVAIPVDKNTLKLKIVNDADVIDGNGKLTVDGFDVILDWIKGQREIINYYSALNDLTNNIVVYSVSRDNDRKQLLLFKIYSKIDLKAQDPSAMGINSQVRFVRQDELAKALSGVILNTKDMKQITNQSTGGNLPLPFPAASIQGATDNRVISFIVLAYNKIKKDPIVAANPIMAKVKAEAVTKKLGQNSALFIKGLNAGFGILDAQFKEDIETDITKTLYDKITFIPESKETYLGLDGRRIVESESAVIAGFDVDAFINTVAAVAANTGDIKVPEGGFREGTQNNPELKKFQDLLAKKFARHLANHATYQAFKKAGAKGYKGNYGPLTSALVKLLKMIAENPKYPNNDGTTIEPEFVNMVQAVHESTGRSYLGLDGKTFIFEDFNFSNAEAVAPSSSIQNSTTATLKKNDSVKVSKEYNDIGTNFTYRVEGGFWKYKNGSVWSKVMNPSSIKKLMEKHPKSEAGGNYVIVPADGFDKSWADGKASFIYQKSGNTWQYSTPGPAGWNNVTDPKSKEYLDKFYGAGSTKGLTDSKGFTKFSGKLSADQIRGLKKIIVDKLDSEKASGNLSDSGVIADFDGVKWKFIRSEYVSSDDSGTTEEKVTYATYLISVDGSIKIDITDPKKTINGHLSSDLKKVKLSSGTIINVADLATLQTSADLKKNDKGQTAESVADLAYMLKDAIEGAGTKPDEIKRVFTKIRTYPEWKAVAAKFKSITGGGSLSDWLDGDLSHPDMFEYVLAPLKSNGLIPMSIWNKYDNDSTSSQDSMKIYRESYAAK